VRLLDNPGHEHENPVDPRWAALGSLAVFDSTTETITTTNVTDAASSAE